MSSPLEQFEIFKIGPKVLGLTISNFTLTLVLLFSSVLLSFHFFLQNAKVIPTRWQNFAETVYSYVLSILVENAGKRSQVYFPFVFVLFIFILSGNIFGMFPLGYTITSQVLITFLLSSTVFLGSIFIGLWKHNVNFFSLFFPSGSPTSLSFLLVPIELISFISKPFSLGIRLFANMLAGHVLLKIIAGFIFSGLWFAKVTSFVGIEIAGLFENFNRVILKFLISVIKTPPMVEFKTFAMSSQTIFPSVTETAPEGAMREFNTLVLNFSTWHQIKLLAFPLDLFVKGAMAIVPLTLLNAFVILEIGIVFLQAYVFVILTSIYIGDAVNLH